MMVEHHPMRAMCGKWLDLLDHSWYQIVIERSNGDSISIESLHRQLLLVGMHLSNLASPAISVAGYKLQNRISEATSKVAVPSSTSASKRRAPRSPEIVIMNSTNVQTRSVFQAPLGARNVR